MRCLRLVLTAAAGVWLVASPAPAQAPPALLSAHGVVDKVTKDTLTVKPLKKPGVAVMDLRQVVLKPAK